MTAIKVIRNLGKRLPIEGIGCFSAVFRLNDSEVLKVGANLNDPWIQFYRFCETNKSKFLPKVKSISIIEDYNIFYSKIERLDPIKDTDIGVARTIDAYTKQQSTKLELLNVLDYISEEDKREFISLLDKLHKAMPDYCKVDLHNNNIMKRGDTFVITDPWALDDMSDILDLESVIW